MAGHEPVLLSVTGDHDEAAYQSAVRRAGAVLAHAELRPLPPANRSCGGEMPPPEAA
jgi:hypothetical protein